MDANRKSKKFKTTPPVQVSSHSPDLDVHNKSENQGNRALGIELNTGTVRQAVILSEIIGKPLSKRSRKKY